MANLFRCLPVCHSGHLCAQVPFQYLAAKLAQVRITTCINCGGIKIPTVQRLSKCLEPSKSLQNTAMRLRCKAQIAKNLQTARTLRSLWSRKGHPFQKLPNFPVLPETFGTLPQKLSNYRTLAAKLTLFVEVQRTFWGFEDFFEALHHCKIRMKRFLGNFR